MNLTDFQHALRLNFTATLAKGMADNNSSFHIVAHDYDGAQRLLEDLKKGIPDAHSVLINIHDFKSSLPGLTWEIARQLAFNDGNRSLADIKLHFEKNASTQYRLLFYNFDNILNRIDIDKAYNNDFIGSLNNLRQMPNVRLVIISTLPGRKYWIHLNGEQQVTLSSFFDGLEEEKMPDCTTEEIRREIARQLPEAPEAMVRDIQSRFAHNYKKLSDVLQFIVNNGLQQKPDWRAQYEKHRDRENQDDAPGFSVRLVKLKEWALRWYTLLGIALFIALIAFAVANWDKLQLILGAGKGPATPTEQPHEQEK